MNPLLAAGLVITVMGVFADAAKPTPKPVKKKAATKPKENEPAPPKPSETPPASE